MKTTATQKDKRNMKDRSKIVAAVALAVAFAAGMLSMKASLIWGSGTTLTTGTNYSAAFALTTVNIPSKSYTVQTGALASTKDLPVWGQVSLGSTNNWVTVTAQWNPPSNAAGTYIWYASATNLTLYARGMSIQTNTVTVSAWPN